MGLRKCPRCELNYIRDDQQYCDICKRDMARDRAKDDTPDLCIECNENVAVPGSDYCVFCLREKRKLESMAEMASKEILEKVVSAGVSDIDDLEIEMDNDIPEGELKEIDEELCDDDLEEDGYTMGDGLPEESLEKLVEEEASGTDEENLD